MIFLRSVDDLRRALASKRVGAGDVVAVPSGALVGLSDEELGTLADAIRAAGATMRARPSPATQIVVASHAEWSEQEGRERFE
jgi:hypothetical protein